MRSLGLILLVTVLLVGQVAARDERAVLLKAYAYQTVRNGFPMPKRILPIGAIVKVRTTHGKKADVATSSGDAVTVRLIDLRPLRDNRLATPPSPAPPTPPTPPTVQRSIAATPVPSAPVAPPPAPVLSAPLAPPDQPGAARDKAAEPGPPHSSEMSRRPGAVRCSHLLKNGAQCSRMTSSPNGLCWQHGGD